MSFSKHSHTHFGEAADLRCGVRGETIQYVFALGFQKERWRVFCFEVHASVDECCCLDEVQNSPVSLLGNVPLGWCVVQLACHMVTHGAGMSRGTGWTWWALVSVAGAYAGIERRCGEQSDAWFVVLGLYIAALGCVCVDC